MAILDPLYGTPLAVQLIPQVDRNFAEHLKLRDDQRSIGLLSVDNDDATYTASGLRAVVLRGCQAHLGKMVRRDHGDSRRTRPG